MGIYDEEDYASAPDAGTAVEDTPEPSFGSFAAEEEAAQPIEDDAPVETVPEVAPDAPLYASGPVDLDGDDNAAELDPIAEVEEDVAEEPEYATDEEEVRVKPLEADQNEGPTAAEIAEKEADQRAYVMGLIVQNHQGRGVPVYVLAQQAEDLKLWIDGECSAAELAGEE